MSNPQEHHQTPPEDRIPIREKIGLCLGYLGITGMGNTVSGQINFIFNITLGVSTALLGTVGFINSIAIFAVQPFMGQFADNFRSRWGRRRPLMAISVVPLVVLMIAMYAFPKTLSEHGLMIWLLATLLPFSLINTVYNPPLSALGIEATTDYHERIRMGMLIMLVVFGFAIIGEWIFPFVRSPVFGDPIQGIRIVIPTLAVVFGISALGPVFLCQEKNYATHIKNLPKSALLPNLKAATKNSQFLIILSIKFLTFFCYRLVGAMGMYMNMYYVFGGDIKKAAPVYGVLGSSYSVAACASFFIYPHIARALGKMRALQIAAGCMAFGCICKLIVYHPGHPWPQLVVLMCNGASAQGINFVIGTMMGDVIDYDELISGKRREALYSSLVSWFEGIGSAFSGLVAGFLLMWIGFNAKFGAQSHHTLQLMRFFYFLFPFIGALFCMFMISRYSLTEQRAYEIKDELKRRHEATKF